MQKVGAWVANVVNHFWYCCSEAKGDVSVLKVNMIKCLPVLYDLTTFFFMSTAIHLFCRPSG